VRAPLRPLASFVLAVVALAGCRSARREGADAGARAAGAPPLTLPFPLDRIDVVPTPAPANFGRQPPSTEDPPRDRGTTWLSAHGPGFGRHEARSAHLLADPAWLLVHAESGLWFVEATALTRRARLRTGGISAIDVTRDGKRLAYAECTLAPRYPFRPSLSDEPCDLVVLDVPSLAELRREKIKAPTAVRFSHDGKTVATSAGHFGGVTVVPLDRARTSWQARAGSTATAAIPLHDARVAYLTTDQIVMIEERDARQQAFVRHVGGPPTDLVLFKLAGEARFDGTMFHDPANDRLLFGMGPKVAVLEGASTASPHFEKEVEFASIAEVTAPLAYAFDRTQYVQRFGLKDESGRGTVLFVPRGDALEVIGGSVYRFGRDGRSWAADFGPAPERVEASLAPADVVVYAYGSNRFHLSRVGIGEPHLDVKPERVGEIASAHDHAPFAFADSSRAFVVDDAEGRGGIVRLPRGGLPAPVEWLGLRALHFAGSFAIGPDRFAFRTEDDVLVEVGPHEWHVVARNVTFGARFEWGASESCWLLERDGKKRCAR
jgi:hypothetical protein